MLFRYLQYTSSFKGYRVDTSFEGGFLYILLDKFNKT